MTQAQSPASAARSLAPVYSGVLEMIGNTPMLELRRLDTGPCRLFAKLELANPAGSIKDRIGLSMIQAAEADGRLDPSGNPRPTIIEATAGNTGLGLALVAGQKGYTLKVVVPDKMSEEKIQHLRAMGAEVILTRSDVQKGHPDYYQDVAARLARQTPNSVFINQFSNQANPNAHYTATGPEAWEQLDGKIDALVVGVGSGGTLSGMGRALRERNPDLRIILADPAGSILTEVVNNGADPATLCAGSWLVEGMGEDFIPDICDIDLVDEAIAVSDRDALLMGRELLAREGILAGSSTGCLLHAACQWCRRQTEPLTVVTLICDQGAKYLSKMFNDHWMTDQGFLARPTHGDLRDLIARRHTEREDYTVKEKTPLRLAIKAMQMYSISQMVVMNADEHVAGIIDESDILLAVTQDENAFDRPVSDFMTRRLETVAPETPVERLTPIFRADRVAIVVDKHGTYHGLITKIDLINFLRKQLAR